MSTDIRLKESLPELTGRIVQTYSEMSTINHLGHCPLPNYETVISVIRGPAGDPLSRLWPPRRPAHGQRHLSRGRPDRRHARSIDAANRAGLLP